MADVAMRLTHRIVAPAHVGSNPTGRPYEHRTLSSVGQSGRLITDWSQVRILQGPPFYWRNTQVWLKGSVLKTERGVKARGGSNPSSSSIYFVIIHNAKVVKSHINCFTNLSQYSHNVFARPTIDRSKTK